MIDKTEEKKMTEKMMIKKTGLALLGLVIGMAFMGGPSVATSETGAGTPTGAPSAATDQPSASGHPKRQARKEKRQARKAKRKEKRQAHKEKRQAHKAKHAAKQPE